MVTNKRNTNQKLKIIEYLRQQENLSTAEEVYEAVKQSLPAISLSTVYRNLNNLSEEGQISKIEINNEYHFDADSCAKMYMVCENCGNVTYKKDALVAEKIMSGVKDFYPDCCQIVIRGLCTKCGGKNGSRSNKG